MRIKSLRQLRTFGCRIKSLNQIKGTIYYEEPISVAFNMFGDVSIGSYTYHGGIGAIRNTTLGRYCSIASNLTIGYPQHPLNWATTHPFAYNGTQHFDFYEKYNELKQQNVWRSPQFQDLSVLIGNDVWIGANVTILKNMSAETGSVLSANSVVLKDISSYEVWGGMPAKKISQRFRNINISLNIIQKLSESMWWTIDPRYLHEAPTQDPLKFIEWIEKNKDTLNSFHPKKWRLYKQGEEVFIDRQ